MNQEENFKDKFARVLEESGSGKLFDPAIRKKKLIHWLLRTMLTILLYLVFWKYDWVKWSLVVVVPLNLFSLFTLTLMPYLLKKKIERVQEKARELDDTIKASEQEAEKDSEL